MTKLLLLDATNIGHRLFHGHDDRPLGERFGFVLDRWRRVCDPDLAVAVFDAPGETWRHELWPVYKSKRNDDPSNRPSASDWAAIKHECRAAGLRCAWTPNTEADDLIGSYTAAAQREDLAVDIVTSDKDLWQLIRASPTSVRVLDPGKGSVADSAVVLERWGVRPDQLADLLALAGDASDNYPGLPGIGPGTAAKLLAKYGSLDNLLDNAALVPGKMSGVLRACAFQARLFRRLSGLGLDLPLPVPLSDLEWQQSGLGVRRRWA